MSHDLIAGHKFNSLGICTLALDDGTPCPVTWPFLRDQCRCGSVAVVGHADLAHRPPNLTPTEYAQVVAADEAEQKRMEDAIYGRSSSESSATIRDA